MHTQILKSRWLKHLAAIVALSALATLGGPFDTLTRFEPGPRFLYWLGMLSLAWGQWVLLTRLLHRWTSANPWPAGVVGTVASFLFAALMAVEILWLQRWLPEAPAPSPVRTYLWIVAITLAICWLTQLLLRLIPHKPWTPAGQPEAQGETQFLKRIPGRIAGRLLSLRAEDHYLRVHTTAGDDLILFRLKDALAELAGTDGMRVHRSFWVARAAVDRVEGKGRKVVLILTNGQRVPVSESYLPAVRQAGWLD